MIPSHIATRRAVLQALALTPIVLSACGQAQPLVSEGARRPAGEGALALIDAARQQIGVTLLYDPAYVRLDYPGGDVPRVQGVCTDVVIRAYRDALGADLQQLVHEDMAAHFSAYPRIWGLSRTDRNIDHRRVPNLRTFWKRQGAALPVSQNPDDWQPGDIFTSMVGGRLPHTGIVSDRLADNGNPLVIHNIGGGTREEDVLFAHDLNGHYRWKLG